jgi:ribosomal protein L29
MKKEDLKNLKEKTIAQLRKKVDKDKLKLRKEMAEFYGKGDKNPKKIRQLKKDIARTLTLLRQKEIEKEVTKEIVTKKNIKQK